MTWRIVVAAVLWWYVMDAAIVYGGIWDSQANPAPEVEAVLGNGQHITGALSRDWQKRWVISTPDGAEVRFADFAMMTFKAPERVDGAFAPSRLLDHWRSVGPVMLANLMFGAFVVAEIFRRNNKQKEEARQWA